jgi:hypothetical protein
MNKIVAITVSTKYDDLLEIIMPQTINFLINGILLLTKMTSKQ